MTLGTFPTYAMQTARASAEMLVGSLRHIDAMGDPDDFQRIRSALWEAEKEIQRIEDLK